jgi:hypothetical protein
MELLINGGSLELPPDFALELEERNPFFSEVGAQSLPMQLPFTPHNLQLLGRPERIAHTTKLTTEYEAIIRHGIFQKIGKLVIFSAGKESGIDATFYLNDGEFYTLIKEIHLNYINFANDPAYHPDPFSGTPAQKAIQWLQHFEIVRQPHNDLNEPYLIFPACTKVIETTDDAGNKTFDYELLNQPDLSHTTDRGHPLLGYEERTVNDVIVPVGYGVSPFLKFNYLLRMLFAHFGYSLQPSLFDTDPDLASMVVLNNNADTICGGTLDYRQLVPNCSVTTFLNTIRNKFCCEFIPDGRTKSINVRFFQDDALDPDADLSPFVAGHPLYTHESFKQVRLSAGASLPFATPAAETMEQFLADYLYSSSADENDFLNAQQFTFGEVIFRQSTGQFYKQSSGAGTDSLVPVGSCFFGYDKKDAHLEYDERIADDEQVPVLHYDPLNQYGNRQLLPIIGERKHLNTGIKKTAAAADIETEAENPDQTKIMLCYPLGTPFCYDYNGHEAGSLSLQYAGANGLFVRFWRAYDALLRHAFRKITCRLQMPLAEFLKFNIYTPKLLNGMPVLPHSIKYSISRKGLAISELQLLTLRLQQPFDLGAEQLVPPFTASDYYWVRNNDAEAVAHSTQYEEAFMNYQLLTAPTKPLPEYDPPTEAQYNAGGKYHQETFRLQVNFWIIDGYTPGTAIDIDTGQVYPGPDDGIPLLSLELDYHAWLEPKKKSNTRP